MANKYPSVPPKTLAVDLSSTDLVLKLTDIADWGGVDLTTASFPSTYIPATLINDSGTRLEFILIVASTIIDATAAGATIYKRGLAYYATDDITVNQTEVAINKLEWTQGETKVLLGTHTPYLFGTFANKQNDEDIEGTWNYDNFPTKNGSLTPTDADQFATRQYVLDIASGGSTSYNAQIIAGVAGETLAINDAVYFKESDQRWWHTDADGYATASNLRLGMVTSVATAGVAVNILTSGVLSTATGLTLGAKYYLSGTPGAITTVPGTIPVFIGWANTTTSLMFFPEGLPTGLIWGTAGENLAIGDLAYLKSADGLWWHTDADATATCLSVNIAFAQTVATTGNPVILRESGIDTTNSGLTPVVRYYVSGTAGAITVSAPTNLRLVGRALSANQLDMNWSPLSVTQAGREIYSDDSSVSANTITVTLIPSPIGYYKGMTVRVKLANSVTGATVVNVNALGNVSVVKGASTALANGDLIAGQDIVLIHDGTNFQVISQLASVLTVERIWKSNVLTHSSAGGNETIAHGLGRTPSFVRITAMAEGANDTTSESVATATSTSSTAGIYQGQGGLNSNAGTFTGGNILLLTDGSSTLATATITTINSTNLVITMGTDTTNYVLLWEVYG